MLGKELRRATLGGAFPGERLGAVLTILDRFGQSRLGPGAAWAVEAPRLVHAHERNGAAQQDFLLT